MIDFLKAGELISGFFSVFTKKETFKEFYMISINCTQDMRNALSGPSGSEVRLPANSNLFFVPNWVDSAGEQLADDLSEEYRRCLHLCGNGAGCR